MWIINKHPRNVNKSAWQYYYYYIICISSWAFKVAALYFPGCFMGFPGTANDDRECRYNNSMVIYGKSQSCIVKWASILNVLNLPTHTTFNATLTHHEKNRLENDRRQFYTVYATISRNIFFKSKFYKKVLVSLISDFVNKR